MSTNTDSLATQGRMSIEEFLGIEYVTCIQMECLCKLKVYCYILRLNPSRVRRKSGTPTAIVPTLLGEMLLHSNKVKVW